MEALGIWADKEDLAVKSSTGEVQMPLGKLLKENSLIGWSCLQVF